MKKLMLAMGLMMWAQLAQAELFVVVNANNPNAVSESDIRRIFLGKMKSFADGSEVIPLNFSDGAPLTDAFNDKVLGKTQTQLKSYWSRLIFTGKGTPPQVISSVDEILELVSSNPNFIAYTDKTSDGVKVVATIP